MRAKQPCLKIKIRGLKAIIHSLSRGEASSPILHQQNGASPNGKRGDPDPQETERIALLERRLQELEGLALRRSYRIEELERELQQGQSNDHRRSRNLHYSIVVEAAQKFATHWEWQQFRHG